MRINHYPLNFSREELIRSVVAKNRNIDNSPKSNLVEANLNKLAWTLQTIRDQISAKTGVERPIHVSSGYRSQKLNAIVTGNPASVSRHMVGLAADITVDGWPPFQTTEFIRDNIPSLKFHKIINEFGSWVHISIPMENELPSKKFITATRMGGNTLWVSGVKDYDGI